MKTIKMAIVGCGNRCRMYRRAFAAVPEAEAIMLCDQDLARARNQLARYPGAGVTDDFQAVLANPAVDAVVIATPDTTHCALAAQALKAGKHLLVEKPLALNAGEARKLLELCNRSQPVLQLAFTLRASPFYHNIRRLLSDGAIGRIMGMEAAEHMGLDHGASYMRRWQRKTALSGGLLTNKCCHDLDLLCWLAGAPLRRVASFGGRNFFNPGRHKATHCSSCEEAEHCPFRYRGSHVSVTEEMEAAPAGYNLDLCVFTSDKDIVDNQVTALEYENDTRATFTIQMFSDRSDRTIHISGTNGFLRGSFNSGRVQIFSRDQGWREEDVGTHASGEHGGGDVFLLRNFAASIRGAEAPFSSCADGVENTLTCIAAETSRVEGRVVELSELRNLTPPP